MESFGNFDLFKQEAEKFMDNPVYCYKMWDDIKPVFTRKPSFAIGYEIKNKGILVDKGREIYVRIDTAPFDMGSGFGVGGNSFHFWIDRFNKYTLEQTEKKLKRWINRCIEC